MISSVKESTTLRKDQKERGEFGKLSVLTERWEAVEREGSLDIGNLPALPGALATFV